MTRKNAARLLAIGVSAAVCIAIAVATLDSIDVFDPERNDSFRMWYVAVPGLLAFAGAMWPVHKGPTVTAIAAAVLWAVAMTLYFWTWQHECPTCSTGSDESRGTDWDTGLKWLPALFASWAIAIVGLAAALSTAVAYLLGTFLGRGRR
jgi:hypothetical protein